MTQDPVSHSEPDPSSPSLPEAATNQPRKSFDVTALERMRAAGQEVLAAHPEVRSVIVVLDYKGSLNQADVNRLVWLGEDGPVFAPDAVIGSLQSTVMALFLMLDRAAKLVGSVEQKLTAMLKEQLKLRQSPPGG